MVKYYFSPVNPSWIQGLKQYIALDQYYLIIVRPASNLLVIPVQIIEKRPGFFPVNEASRPASSQDRAGISEDSGCQYVPGIFYYR